MANRNFMNGGKVFSMSAAPVLTTCTIQIGATGAVSSFVGPTVQSVVRNSAGNYTITLQAQTNYPTLMFASGSLQSASGALSGVATVEIQNAPNTSLSASSGAITVKCLDVAGAAVDPASGSALNVMIICNNSKGAG